MEAVFVDSDIILDLLAEREPFSQYAKELFTLADKGEVICHISSLCFSNVQYILAKQIGKNQARQVLIQLKTLVKVLGVGDKIIDLALSSNIKDFEDAIQYYTAIANSCQTLLTRNLKDYKEAQIPAMTAESFLRLKNS